MRPEHTLRAMRRQDQQDLRRLARERPDVLDQAIEYAAKREAAFVARAVHDSRNRRATLRRLMRESGKRH